MILFQVFPQRTSRDSGNITMHTGYWDVLNVSHVPALNVIFHICVEFSFELTIGASNSSVNFGRFLFDDDISLFEYFLLLHVFNSLGMGKSIIT